MLAKFLQSCPTLEDPMDCSPPGSSVHGILQARILEWVAMLSSRGSSWPRDWTQRLLHLSHRQVDSLPLAPPGKPQIIYICLCNLFKYWLRSYKTPGGSLSVVHVWPHSVAQQPVVEVRFLDGSVVKNLPECRRCRRPRFDPWVGKIL